MKNNKVAAPSALIHAPFLLYARKSPSPNVLNRATPRFNRLVAMMMNSNNFLTQVEERILNLSVSYLCDSPLRRIMQSKTIAEKCPRQFPMMAMVALVPGV